MTSFCCICFILFLCWDADETWSLELFLYTENYDLRFGPISVWVGIEQQYVALLYYQMFSREQLLKNSGTRANLFWSVPQIIRKFLGNVIITVWEYMLPRDNSKKEILLVVMFKRRFIPWLLSCWAGVSNNFFQYTCHLPSHWQLLKCYHKLQCSFENIESWLTYGAFFGVPN